MKRKMVALLFLVMVLAVGCGRGTGSDEKNTSETELPKLRIGVMYSADIIPLAVMREQEIDRKNGFVLDMQVFSSAKDRDAALQAGALDGVFTDYIGVCMYQNAGIDVKITGSTDGDYQLVAGGEQSVGSLEECRDKTIAISENTLIEYALDYILEKKGYDSDYLQKTVVPRIPERVEMLAAGQVDMGLLPEPFATVAKNDGAVLLGSANEVGLYPAVSAFLQTTLEGKSSLIPSYYAAYDEAVDYVNQAKVEDLEDMIVEKAGFPDSLRGKIVLPVYRRNELPKKEDLHAAIQWAAGKGLCSGELTPEALLGILP